MWIWLGGQAAAGEGTQRPGTKQLMLYEGKTFGNVTVCKLEGRKMHLLVFESWCITMGFNVNMTQIRITWVAIATEELY